MFLFPLYLLGAAALGVPLWVHLRNRQQRPPYRFPTLKFLMESSIVSERRRQLMRWLVLLLRLGALAALALAFAQPWLQAAILPGSKAAVLVLDTSASMATANVWPAAQRRAVDWLGGQPRDARVSVVTIGRSAQPLTTFGDSIDAQLSAVRSLKPTFESADADVALRLASRLLEQQPVAAKSIAVVSDLTVEDWRNVDWDKPLAPGVAIDATPIAADELGNVAIVQVEAPRSFWMVGQPVTVRAVVRNYSTDRREIIVTCDGENGGDDAKRPRTSIAIDGGATREVEFAITPTELTTFRGTIRLESPDALAADDRRFFTIPAHKPFRVTYWSDGSDGEAATFLKVAVQPTLDSANRFQWVDSNEGTKGPLAKHVDALMLDQGASLDANRAAQLEAFVRDGGKVVVFLGDADSLTDSEANWLPIALGAKRSSDSPSGVLRPVALDFRHPVLDPFARPRSGDLFSVGVSRWRSFTSPVGSPLIALPGGDPMLSLLSHDKARIAVFAMPMRRAWTDLPVHPTFLPLLHETLKWLQGNVSQDDGLLVGDVGPDAKVAREPGFAAGPDAQTVAVNLDPRESDLKRWTMLDRFKQLEHPDRNEAVASAPTSPDNAIRTAGDDPGQRLTWFLLLAVGLFSMTELLLANRTPR